MSWKVLDQEDHTDGSSDEDSDGATLVDKDRTGQMTAVSDRKELPHHDTNREVKTSEPTLSVKGDPCVVRGQQVRKAPEYLRDFVTK